MIGIISILISLAIFIFNYSINVDIFYPPALFSLIWSLILIAYGVFIFFNPEDIFRIDNECLFIFIAGQIFFTLGGLFAVNRKIKDDKAISIPYIKYSFDKYLFVILLILLPVYLYKLYGVLMASSYNAPSILMVLRYEFSVEEIDIGIIKYVNTFAFFAFAIAIYKFNFTNDKPVTFWQKAYRNAFYLLIIIYAFLSTGRTYFLFNFCIFMAVKIIGKKIKLKHYAFIPILVFSVFSINAILLDKGGSTEASFSDNILSIFQTFVIYLLGGLYAFNTIIHSNFNLEFGQNTFRFFIAIANSIGLTDTPPKDLVMPFISKPIESNVYSIYYPYVQDFWYFGIGFLSLWSFIQTWFYYRAKKNFTYFFWYAILLYPLIMSFFQDQYVNLLSTWIQLCIYAFIAKFFIGYNKTIAA